MREHRAGRRQGTTLRCRTAGAVRRAGIRVSRRAGIRVTHRAGIRAARADGAVLPVVLLISSMMLVTSAAWFESSLAAARGTTNVRDYLQAFHAADSALTLCTRTVLTTAIAAAPTVAGEPAAWRSEAAFEANAVAPAGRWPGSVRPPQCLVEAWRLITRPDARAYLLTARGFGRTRESQAWLQLELVIDGDRIERHWRRVAARPF